MSESRHRRFVATARAVHPDLAAAVSAAGPLPRLEAPRLELAEALCRAVVGQQLSTRAARAIWGRLTAAAGDDLLGHLRSATPEELRACGLSAAKVRTLAAIRAAYDAGELEPRRLGRLDCRERAAALTAIHGIGPWTADMLALFWFRDPDVWPGGDLAVRRTLQRLTAPDQPAQETAARFAPYRSLLARYLWRITDLQPV